MPRVLTGIKPTGTVHLGNYLGAVRPTVRRSRTHETFVFVADVHALNLGLCGPDLDRASLDVAAVWLASGLNTDQSFLYLQSQVPEILRLSHLLLNLVPKGLLNRAHAYKAATAANRSVGRDPDEGVNLGLYTYPVLMAADILGPRADLVPVGQDQAQHLEMTVDLAQAANRRWRADLAVPRALIEPEVAVVPGTDGNKMSKSRGNVLPLAASADRLARLIRKIPTDSTPVGAPKDPSSNPLSAWVHAVAPAQAVSFDRRLEDGSLSWGGAKDEAAHWITVVTAPVAEAYVSIRADEPALRRRLSEGADRVRRLVSETLGAVERGAFGVESKV